MTSKTGDGGAVAGARKPFQPGDKPKVITSAKQLEKLIEPGRYRDHDVKGLFLQVTNARNRSWILRYQFEKQRRSLGLGPYPEVGLTAARNRAREIRSDMKLHKLDPLAKRQEEQSERAVQRAKAQTFQQAAERFYEKAQLEWKTEGQRRAFRNTMAQYVFPIIGDMNVAAIDTPAVLRVLQTIWDTKPTVANLLRIRIEAILAMAAVGGYRASGDNPARWAGHLALMLPSHAKTRKVESHAALPYAELPGFMAALRAQDDVAAKALQFIVLTAARKMEVLNATWDEIDMKAKLWVVPAERMKGGREHVVPLSDAAMAILHSLPREDGNPHLFIGAKAGEALKDGMAFREALKRLGGEDVTTHGFRSSFRDWAGDMTHFQREVIEAALAHAVGDKTEQAYRRTTAIEQRRLLMEAWAGYCASTPGEDGKVLPFKATAGSERG